MEEEEIQTQPLCKFSRVSSNGRSSSNTSKIGQKGGSFENQLLYPPDEEEEDVELNKRPNLGTIVVSAAGGGGGGDSGATANRLRGWHHSSRIIRVSRASGGKDRHSKVWTSKGLRDRRVRLSVTTAIQFYDLQDRLGYDQPSKAVEWLIKAAADSINELPSLNGSNFPDTPKQLSDEKGFDDSADVELEDPNFSQNQNQNQHFSLSKSACSSTSDTSKGSGLSLSRPDVRVSRVKARERARERTAKEKEKEGHESSHIVHHQNVNNPISQNSTFTELLTSGISSVSNNNSAAAATASPGSEANLFHNHNKGRQWPNLTPMDYFSTGLLGPTSARTSHPHSSGFQLGNSSIPQAMTMSIPPYSFSGENNHQEQLQHFPFLSDHLIPVATTTQQQQQQGHGGDYNLNFTISSSGLAGFNRGTLQSNSSSSPPSFMPHHHHLQRLSSSSIDGSSNLPFFIGSTAAPQPPPMENHHQHQQHHHHHQFPPGLQLYGDGSRHSDHKGKGKN